ncbi:hypothetical protein IV83_GL001679 [Pediococcus inopinatus]|nr:hypothetical protein IV83_GL001679 [Pediococcus inopinatus]
MKKMHEIPKTAFAKTGNYKKEKVAYIKDCFTSMRILINDQIFPQSQKNSDKKSNKVVGELFGLVLPETVKFDDTGMQVIGKDKEVVATTKSSDIQYIQFGVIRKMSTYLAPGFYYELAITIGIDSGNYYLLNDDFAVYEQLKAWCNQQNISLEDPFELESITGEPSTWKNDLDSTFVDKVAKAEKLNYPEEVQTKF